MLYSTGGSQSTSLLFVWKGKEHLIKLTAHDEVTYPTRNSTPTQRVQFIHQYLSITPSFTHKEETKKSAYEVAALNRQWGRLTGRVKQPLEYHRVLGDWKSKLGAEVVSNV